MPIRRKITLLLGLALVFLGIIWSLQGSGAIGGSAIMSDNPTFIYVGSLVSLIGFLLLIASYRPGAVAKATNSIRS